MSGEYECLVGLKRPSGGHCKSQSQNFLLFFRYKVPINCVKCIPVICMIVFPHKTWESNFFLKYCMISRQSFHFSNVQALTINTNMNALHLASTISHIWPLNLEKLVILISHYWCHWRILYVVLKCSLKLSK